MTEIIITPDVDAWAYHYLGTALASRPEPFADAVVSVRVPATLPRRLVWVRRDGGQRISRVLDVPRLGVNVVCESEQDCAGLASLVAALLLVGADGDPVTSVKQTSGPSPIDDPSGRPRRYMTFEMTVRGAAA